MNIKFGEKIIDKIMFIRHLKENLISIVQLMKKNIMLLLIIKN